MSSIRITILAGLFLLGTTSGCTSQAEIELARARGIAAGHQEGLRAGEIEGFGAAANAAREEAYQATLTELESVGEYNMRPIYTATVLVGSFMLGFVVQWVGFFLPRRIGLLADIDWMILPSTVTNLELAGSVDDSVQHLNPPTACILLLLALGASSGCRNAEKEAWQSGYNEAYRAAFHEGWRGVADKAAEEGTTFGKSAAKAAAASGRDWHLYGPFAFLFATIGMLIGVFTQYMVMLNCRSGGIPAFLAIALVPAMKYSLAYRLFEEKRQLMIAASDEIRAVALAKNLKIAQMSAVQQVMARKLKAISTLEEFSQTSLLSVAREEMDRIIAASEQSLPKASHTFKCPHCSKPIGYPSERAGSRVNCPYRKCRRSITLPTLGDSP